MEISAEEQEIIYNLFDEVYATHGLGPEQRMLMNKVGKEE